VLTVSCTNFRATDGAAQVPFTIAPAITTQPASVVATQGAAATFTVATSGTLSSFQWARNGADIAGATSASFSLASVLPADEGSYTVTVANTAGSVTSSAATLTVNTLPVITVQPKSLIVNSGTTGTFSVTAAGKPAPTYQWKKNGATLTGATSATYTTPAAAGADTGAKYTASVTNSVGSVTSVEAVLSVVVVPTNEAPRIVTEPADATVAAGAAATFSVVASGSPAPAYKWYRNGTAITGATAASYTTAAAVAADTGSLFKVDVSNVAGTVTSRSAKLTVSTPVIPVTLFNNGSFVSHPGVGPGGTDLSVVQNELGLTTTGSGGTSTLGNGFSVADDFTVTNANGWTVDEAVFSLYLSNGAIVPPLPVFTCNLQIWDGNPANAASKVIWGDTTTNRATTIAFIGYRVASTAMTVATRPLYSISCKGLGINLAMSTYWVEYRAGYGSAIYTCPLVVIGQSTTGNAVKITSGVFTPWTDAGLTTAQQGLPFLLKGIAK
jgi:hypothetical protein